MNKLNRYKPRILQNGTDRYATMMTDVNGKWYFCHTVDQRFKQKDLRIKGLENRIKELENNGSS